MSDFNVENRNLDNETTDKKNIVDIDEISDEKNTGNIKVDTIREKSFAFAVRIMKLCKYLEKHTNVAKPIIIQLLKAGSSIGANLEEAVAGQSKSDFIHKNAISLKEVRETNYWLRLILETETFDQSVRKGIEELKVESLSIAKIIGSIIVKAKKQTP